VIFLNFDYLKDSEVALKEEGSSKKLTITAPNAKGEAPKEDAPLEEKIEMSKTDMNVIEHERLSNFKLPKTQIKVK
jgi:hypothetical protein